MNTINKSQALFRKAQTYMPGGVNSPVRACTSVGMHPRIIREGRGSKLYDVDGNEYIDYVCSWGPLILGHAHPDVVDAVCTAAQHGTSFGASCEQEIELARLICEAVPSIKKIRMVNSGTEATMSAVRLARAFTGRNKIVKFEGCYHGHADSFLIKAGSGLLTTGVPTSPGVPGTVAEQTLIAQYNDLESITALFDQAGADIAAVIVEPVAGNMGLVLPGEGFLQGLRRITAAHGTLLIFDEVITGFRLCYGAYQDMAGVQADLTTFGKIIGGGLPVGAYGGRREIMDIVSPQGPVYQAGTLSGNPLAMAAGCATLKLLKNMDFYKKLDGMSASLAGRVKDIFQKQGVPFHINRIGSLFSLFFTHTKVVDYRSVMTCNTALFARFYKELLEQGIYFPPSQYETCFVSCAHDSGDIEKTVSAIDKAVVTILK
jgi:glutamate-1-semialdehyde 2,1-aminomutase